MTYKEYTMFYIATRHNSNSYMLGSSKLTGSPLILIIITRAIYKTSFIKHTTLKFNCSWFVIQWWLSFSVFHSQSHAQQYLPFPCSSDTQYQWAWVHISPTCTSLCFLSFRKTSLFPNISFRFTSADSLNTDFNSFLIARPKLFSLVLDNVIKLVIYVAS